MIDATFYLGLATEITGKLRRLSAFTRHGPSIGLHHEEIVREAIRPLLSKRFSLRTGFAFGGEDAVSRQGDILVVDESDPTPYFFQMGDLVVVHPRALACVIEVKTELSKDTLLQALDVQHSFKQVARVVAPTRDLPTLVFAFDGAEFRLDTLHEWYTKVELPNDVGSYPYMVYALRRGTLMLRPARPLAAFGHYLVLGEESDDLKAKGLSLLLQTIRKTLEVKAGVESDPFDVSVVAGLRWSVQCLQFGTGLVENDATS